MNRKKIVSFKINLLVFSVLSTLNMATVVQADPSAHIVVQQQQKNSSVDILNIAAAINGYSSNSLTSFDVSEAGLILNNSPDGADTQLSGHIDGNSNLSSGAAKEITLEVNAKKAITLNGPVEVAGTKARVILSNPAGIICSSCNFLSADRVVLTTGKVNIQNDTVDSYKVEKGNITVKGNATFDKSAQQIDLIARNVSIETPLDASGINVNVITGANEVKAQDNTVVAQKPTGVASKYSLQIVKNAGVRSSSLKFIGTEANSPLKNNGNVETAGGGIELIHSGALDNNKGNFLSEGDIYFAFDKGVTNSTGEIQSTKTISIETKEAKIDNISGGNISADGNVTINSGEFKNNASYIASKDKLDIQTNGKPITNTATVGEGVGISATNGIKINSGLFNNKEGQINSKSVIDINTNLKDFNNIDAYIDASGDISINSGAMNNTHSRLRSVTRVEIDTNGKALKNTGMTADTASDDSLGILSGLDGMTVNIAGLNNDQGIIATDGDMNFTNKGDITNKWGHIKSGGYLTFSSDKIKNLYGGLASKTGANVTFSQTLDNNFGVFYLEGDSVTISAPYINNNKGVIKGDAIYFKTDKFNNTSGFVITEQKLEIDTPEMTNNSSLDFKTEMGFYLGQPDQKGGLISKGEMKLSGNKLVSNKGRIVTENGDMELKFTSVDNTSGTIASHKNASVVTSTFTNSQGTLFGQDKLTLQTDTLKNNSTGSVESNTLKGVIASSGDTEVTVNRDFENNGVISGVEHLRVNINGKYTNASNSIMSGKNSFELGVTGNIINRGILNSIKDTTISGENITNEKSGIIVGRESITIDNKGTFTNKGKVVGPLNK
ncbi:filamentous hemagglutinin N-terminal domain-containing protein [Proteus mirabilis]|uniref:two-partner secretion domain-containing protein n=1 Tax=Proteus mirabilis TaxID=584 RepID=UPI001E39063D|nr:filamentous hemagglutinin N-terminal domain-containing protein [Proteus mirabilis]MCD4627399.1 filamentous hemagglutinin N-terminal domain-containing protein [Proteus mirabilis]